MFLFIDKIVSKGYISGSQPGVCVPQGYVRNPGVQQQGKVMKFWLTEKKEIKSMTKQIKEKGQYKSHNRISV